MSEQLSKNTIFEQDKICEICSYPLKGTDKEKSIFIGKRYSKEFNKNTASLSLKRSRILLFCIGGIHFLEAFYHIIYSEIIGSILFCSLFCAFFTGMAFLAKIKPVLALSFTIGVYLHEYLLSRIIYLQIFSNWILLVLVVFIASIITINKIRLARS